MVTTISTGVPVQPLYIGVTVYVAVPALPVRLTNVSLILLDDAAVRAVPPVNPVLSTGAGHVNTTPSPGFVKLSIRILYDNGTLEQVVVVCPLVITASGFIVTTTS